MVFVVLLLSLVPGAAEAGRTIGWEPTWILRDLLTWTGFATIAFLSLAELTIAWSKPEHAEEGATVLLTACGVGVTGLLARRLLRMSDPATQLGARIEVQLPRLVRILEKERRKARKRAREQGLNETQARLLALTPHPAAQSGMAGVLKPMFGFAVRSVHEGRWDQAQQAHAWITHTVSAYVEAAQRITLQDTVIEVFTDRTNDLHELASGPHGRDVSTTLFNGISEVGKAIASSHRRHDLHEGGALHRLGHTASLMARRRFDDDRSTDPGHGLTVLSDLAALAAQIGDGATAVGIGEPLLEIAAPATDLRRAHIAGPAWRGAVKILRSLALVDNKYRDPSALDLWSEKIAQAVTALSSIPTYMTYSGAEPLLQLDPVEPDLIHTLFYIWVSDLHIDSKRRLDRRLGDALLAPVAATAPEERLQAAEVAAEVWHQMACAAASGAIKYPAELHAAVEALTAKLSTVRSLWAAEQDAVELLHVYATDWIICLYITRDIDGMPDPLREELRVFEETITQAVPYSRGPVREACEWLVSALARGARSDEAEHVASWALPQNGSPLVPLAGLIGGWRLHVGLANSPVILHAQHWWLGSSAKR